MVRVEKMKYYNIYSDKNGSYIVHNLRKEFSKGHTHVDSFKTAKYIAYLSLYKKIPKKGHLSNYLIDSIIRISTDKEYIKEIEKLKIKKRAYK